MSSKSLLHFGISVKNLDAAIQWYSEAFGFVLAKRFEKPELKIKGATITLGDGCLEILEPYSPVRKKREKQDLPQALSELGANHFALTVDDINASYQRLREMNAEFTSEIMDGRFFFCRAPDGTLLEVRQK